VPTNESGRDHNECPSLSLTSGANMSDSNVRLRLGRVIVFGVLTEIATILLIVVTITIHASVVAAGKPESVVIDFAKGAPAVIGPVAGMLFTFVAAKLATRPLTGRFRTHGALVGVVAALVTIPGLVAGDISMLPLYVTANLLKIVAGAAGGALSEKRRATLAEVAR